MPLIQALHGLVFLASKRNVNGLFETIRDLFIEQFEQIQHEAGNHEDSALT